MNDDDRKAPSPSQKEAAAKSLSATPFGGTRRKASVLDDDKDGDTLTKEGGKALSVSETNALRKRLGLAPLKEETLTRRESGDDQNKNADVNADDEKKEDDVSADKRRRTPRSAERKTEGTETTEDGPIEREAIVRRRRRGRGRRQNVGTKIEEVE